MAHSVVHLTCWSKSSQTILCVVSFRAPFSNVVWTKILKKLYFQFGKSRTKPVSSYVLCQNFIILYFSATKVNFLPFCLHHIFWCQTAGEHRIHLVKYINLRKKSSWNDPWQSFSVYRHVLSPVIYQPAVAPIACVTPYIVSWKFQICGNMANEMRHLGNFRERIRKTFGP